MTKYEYQIYSFMATWPNTNIKQIQQIFLMTPSPNKLNWRVPKNLSFDVGSKLSLNMPILNDHTTQKRSESLLFEGNRRRKNCNKIRARNEVLIFNDVHNNHPDNQPVLLNFSCKIRKQFPRICHRGNIDLFLQCVFYKETLKERFIFIKSRTIQNMIFE